MAECEELPIFQEPQCLITTDRKGLLMIRGSVLDQVRSLERKLVVIAIAGDYRTGKSYLMNRLAGKSAGFALGSTIQSKTKGIWIWVRPHPKDIGTYLVLMDTEGLNDAEKGDSRHDESILTLANLLSSTIVYNYLGTVSDNVITKLNFVSTVSRILKGNPSRRPNPKTDMPPPLFIMALRDFCPDLVIDGKEVTADEYLEHILKARDNRSNEFNALRKNIREGFPERKCFTFDRPTHARAKLRKLETLNKSDLNEDFLYDSHIFTTFVYNKCPEMIHPNGTFIRGSMYASLVTSYVEAIRDNRFPCIENALKSLADDETRRAIEMADRKFREEMRRSVRFPVDQPNLDPALTNATKSARILFARSFFVGEDLRAREKLDERIEALQKEFKRLNKNLSDTKCQEMLSVLDLRITRNCGQGQYSVIGGHAAFLQDIEQVKAAYNKCENLGVKKESALKKYLWEAERRAELLQQTEAKLKREQRNREAAEALRLEAEKRAEEEQRRKERMKREMREREQAVQYYRDNLRLKNELQIEQDRLKFEEDLDKDLEARRMVLTGQHNRSMRQLRREKDSLESTYKEELDRLIAAHEETLTEEQKEYMARIQLEQFMGELERACIIL